MKAVDWVTKYAVDDVPAGSTPTSTFCITLFQSYLFAVAVPISDNWGKVPGARK